MTLAAPLELPAALAAAGVSLRPVAEGDFPFLRHLYRSLRWEEPPAIGVGSDDDANNPLDR